MSGRQLSGGVDDSAVRKNGDPSRSPHGENQEILVGRSSWTSADDGDEAIFF
jgi:hypothetical protein